MIIFYCHKCGQKGEFEKKADMKCGCGNYEGGGKVEANPYGWPSRDARNGGKG